jgi:hypothetical protein
MRLMSCDYTPSGTSLVETESCLRLGSSMSLPFSTFDGQLKQLDTDFKYPIMRELFDAAFPAFEGLELQQSSLQEAGIKAVVSTGGVQLTTGRRARRFAGDTNLPPGRYFTLCERDTFDDQGTLRDELYGYYRGGRSVDVAIFDPTVDTEIFADFQARNLISAEQILTPLYAFMYRIPRRTAANQHLLDQYGEHLTVGRSFMITYGVRWLDATIEKVIDLRRPDTQDWFVSTFVEMELANERRAWQETGPFFFPKKRLTSFAELLPVIVSLEMGGGNAFGQAVGAWLRQQGANGLIFPSARSNAECHVWDGQTSECRGWNMVLYGGAQPPTESNLFGHSMTWRDPDHDHIRVHHTANGAQRGSLSIRGTKEWNLLNFDIQRQIAHGRIDGSTVGFSVAMMTGTLHAAITARANEFLDNAAKKDCLWFRDVDTTSFMILNQECWPDPSDAE